MAVFHGKKPIWLMAFKRSLANENTKRVYGRRQGRPLNKSRAEVIETLLPALSIPTELLCENGSLTPSSLFKSDYKECWLEIGFGAGEHLSALMRQHPENTYLGAEPFINGMAAFLKDIKDEPHDKIRVLMDDAMMLANSLADNSLDGLYILNPDPWHKKRHHKRRIVKRDNLEVFARILKPGGQLIMSTDVPDLAEWMITETMIHDGFEWTAKSAQDWKNSPDDWITTAYEKKGAKGADKMVYLFFEKKA